MSGFKVRGLSLSNFLTLSRTKMPARDERRRVFICIADHYEPMWLRPAPSVQMERVERWARGYPIMAAGIADSRGRAPQHSFFYPQDEYLPEHAQPIAELCRQGFGDMEVHLHHDHDTPDGLREKLLSFADTLHHEHGMLRRDEQGRLSYAFVHGNWALDNSRPDGRWCGVNNEISILIETGCYADMTMPSAPNPCQTSTVNSIYYATDDPQQPKSHDRGTAAQVGKSQPDNSLLMIQGPLALDWSKRKWGVMPGIENSDLTGNRPATLARLKLWLGANVHVVGREDWTFIKLHTHGAQEANAAMFLDGPMRAFHQSLARHAAEQSDFKYYYVTAYEMAALVRQAEGGNTEPNFDFAKGATSMPIESSVSGAHAAER
jgi:hypothetical protein